MIRQATVDDRAQWKILVPLLAPPSTRSHLNTYHNYIILDHTILYYNTTQYNNVLYYVVLYFIEVDLKWIDRNGIIQSRWYLHIIWYLRASALWKFVFTNRCNYKTALFKNKVPMLIFTFFINLFPFRNYDIFF